MASYGIAKRTKIINKPERLPKHLRKKIPNRVDDLVVVKGVLGMIKRIIPAMVPPYKTEYVVELTDGETITATEVRNVQRIFDELLAQE